MISATLGIAGGAVGAGPAPEGGTANPSESAVFAALVEQALGGEPADRGRGGGEAGPTSGEGDAKGARAGGLMAALPDRVLAFMSKAQDQGRPDAAGLPPASPGRDETENSCDTQQTCFLQIAVGAETERPAIEQKGRETPGMDSAGGAPAPVAAPMPVLSQHMALQPRMEPGAATPEEPASCAGPLSTAPVAALPRGTLNPSRSRIADGTEAPAFNESLGQLDGEAARQPVVRSGLTLVRSETHLLPPQIAAGPLWSGSRSGALDGSAVPAVQQPSAAVVVDANRSPHGRMAGEEAPAAVAPLATREAPALGSSVVQSEAPPGGLADQIAFGIVSGQARAAIWPAQTAESHALATTTVRPTDPLRSGVVRSIQFELHPGDMGSVVVRMSMRNDAVRLQLSFSAEKAAEQARADQAALSHALSMAGLPVDALAITTAQGPPPSSGHAAAHGQVSDGRSPSPDSGAGRQPSQDGQQGDRERRGSTGNDGGRRGADQGNETTRRTGLFV